MYYNYLFLEPGSYLTVGGADLGESQDGIKIAFQMNEIPLYNQKLGAPYNVRIDTVSARVSSRIITLDSSSINTILGLSSNKFPGSSFSVPGLYQLIVSGKYIGASTSSDIITITFYQASVVRIGDLELKRTQESGIEVEFLCMYDLTQNAIFKVVYS